MITEYFGNLREPTGPDTTDRRVATYGIGALASRLGVTARRVRRWIRAGAFPETPYWIEGTNRFSHRRRYTAAMLDAAERIADELGLLDKRRWDLAESDFGDLVSEAWFRSERDYVDPTLAWRGVRGWDANPKTSPVTPRRRRCAEPSLLAFPILPGETTVRST